LHDLWDGRHFEPKGSKRVAGKAAPNQLSLGTLPQRKRSLPKLSLPENVFRR
jgi:hypothetical protein